MKLIRIHVERTNKLYNSIGELNADIHTINAEHILLLYFIKHNIKTLQHLNAATDSN